MAKKPLPNQVAAPQGQAYLHLNLDSNFYDSEEDVDGDGDFSEFSDSDDDFNSDVTLEELATRSLNLSEIQESERLPQAKSKIKAAGASNGDSMALVPADMAANDPYHVESDEEQELLKGIKDEIRDMVREEMHSELAVYQHKMKAIEAGRLPSAAGDTTKEDDKYPDLANLEPELKEAYIKMRKLDRILDKKLQKEREVKRDRILLERRIRDEIGTMQANGRVQRDIQANTDRYLSLALPPSHNEGVVVDEPPVTPLFQTQVNENDLKERSQQKPPSASPSQDDRQSSATSSRTDGTDSTMDGDRSRKHGHRKKKRKDFIKRNKELAAAANDMIAMTDDEKKRLQELLTEVDTMPEIAEEGLDVSVEDNPYQVVIHPGEGFIPSDTDLRTLTAIDQRLQSIMPEEDFRSIASSALSHVPQQRLFTRVGARAEVDFESYGERALIETKEEREATTKLKDIEERLTSFQNTESVQSETPGLSEEQLESLLDDCVRSMSRISMPADTPESVDSARTLESARAQLMVNPPKLSEETLQKLLSEAHFPLSTHLLALQDDDSKSASGDDGMSIRAETWKAIADETLSGEEGEESGSGEATPRGMADAPIPRHVSIRQSSVVPHPSLSDTSAYTTMSRKPPLHRLGSHASDSDGRDSRISLPDICSSPLINMPQGDAAEAPNNSHGLQRNGRGGVRTSSSLDSMAHNDMSRASPYHSLASPSSHRMAGTPLLMEEFGGQELGQSTPVPQPPPASDRRSGQRLSRRASGETPEADPRSSGQSREF